MIGGNAVHIGCRFYFLLDVTFYFFFFLPDIAISDFQFYFLKRYFVNIFMGFFSPIFPQLYLQFYTSRKFFAIQLTRAT